MIESTDLWCSSHVRVSKTTLQHGEADLLRSHGAPRQPGLGQKRARRVAAPVQQPRRLHAANNREVMRRQLHLHLVFFKLVLVTQTKLSHERGPHAEVRALCLVVRAAWPARLCFAARTRASVCVCHNEHLFCKPFPRVLYATEQRLAAGLVHTNTTRWCAAARCNAGGMWGQREIIAQG